MGSSSQQAVCRDQKIESQGITSKRLKTEMRSAKKRGLGSLVPRWQLAGPGADKGLLKRRPTPWCPNARRGEGRPIPLDLLRTRSWNSANEPGSALAQIHCNPQFPPMGSVKDSQSHELDSRKIDQTAAESST